MYRPYRRAIQVGVFAMMFIVPLLNVFEVYAVTGTFYAVNIGGLGIADPVVILQAMFAAGRLTPPLLASALFPVFLALLFGRVWCGWACPYHLLADGTAWLRTQFKKILLGKVDNEPLAIAELFKANMSRFGFLMLGTVVAGAIGIPVLNYVSAPGIVSTEAMIFVKERAVSFELGFIVLLLVVELFFFPRFWCRLFCPTGAFLSLFRAPFTLRVATTVKTPKSSCCSGNHCSAACPMGLAAFKEGGNLLCTNCSICIDACRKNDGPGKLRFTGYAERAGR